MSFHLNPVTRKIRQLPPPTNRAILQYEALHAGDQFPNTTFVSSVSVGYRTQGSRLVGSEHDKGMRLEHARIHYMRYNDLSEQSRLACADIAPQHPHVKAELAKYRKEFDKMQKDWQNRMWSPSASSFFAQFVTHTVTQYNTNTHVRNLLVAAKMKSFNVNPQATMEQRNERIDLLTAAREHLDVWERSVSDQLDKAKAEYTSLSIESPANVQCARLQYHIQRLYGDLHDIKLSRQVDATYEHMDSVDDVPPPEPYYEELDTKAAYEFWNHRLDLATATNIWTWARKSVPIEANLQAPNIGTVMSQTFSLMAHQTWTHVLRPRYENQMIRRALSQAGPDALADLILVTTVGAPELQREDSRLVYRMLRESNQHLFDSMPGIESVMVPSSGLNRQREGKLPKRDLEDHDIQFITPIAKRQNVRFI